MNFRFDIALPLSIICLAVLSLLLKDKYAHRFREALRGKEFKSKDAIILSAAIGVMVSLVAAVPSQALVILFLSAYSLLLFQFSYLMRPKWPTSVLMPVLFLVLYFLFRDSVYWNPLILDVFAAIFAVLVSTFLGITFSWGAAVAFAVAITAVDIFQVLYTGYMVMAFEKTIGLDLPVALIVPVVPLIPESDPLYPALPYAFSGLGLGDLSLVGLLVTKTAEKYGRGLGLATALSMGISFFIFETLAMNFGGGFYPATVFVVSGWIIALFGKFIIGLVRPSPKEKT
ncbi:MAG: hypothetical protein QXF26_00185 [Candidatus Bathyarchaeia archaeon]